ncbi:MAG: hypothetical protein A2X80_11100 [Geobacteraceae bacterium GWB2_52_12]|nr:MAG: hypothetical protein A2X80_11100 [Geobacteraceae bacterium GWB2_52_12]
MNKGGHGVRQDDVGCPESPLLGLFHNLHRYSNPLQPTAMVLGETWPKDRSTTKQLQRSQLALEWLPRVNL